ncbi:MAG: hypothetical protein C0397_19900 [Odoribacter sp.]|nr:hypothetical protein [Odoribacter sp.]
MYNLSLITICFIVFSINQVTGFWPLASGLLRPAWEAPFLFLISYFLFLLLLLFFGNSILIIQYWIFPG